MMKILNKPLVSVIIPTYNAAEFIDGCLKSIESQTYKNIEVIIVDQSSEDETRALTRKYKMKLIELPKPTFYSPPTKSRNAGAKEAAGKYLLHLDADMEAPEGLIDACINKCEENGFDAVVIHEIDIPIGFWARCKALERSCYVNDPDIEGARFSAKDIFERVGGYDENLSSGEDWDIHYRMQKIGKITEVPIFIRHNQGRINFFKYLKKKYNYGKTFDKYVNKYPKKYKKQLTLFRAAYFKNWNKLMRQPVLACGFIILKISEFSIAGLGYLYAKLFKG